jgi:predicted ATPase
MNTKFQIYTVPGQVYYNSTRKKKERIGREGISSTLTLKRVGIRETRHLLSIFLNRTDFPEGFVETVYRQTEGNPFFIEEFVRSRSSQSVLLPNNG